MSPARLEQITSNQQKRKSARENLPGAFPICRELNLINQGHVALLTVEFGPLSTAPPPLWFFGTFTVAETVVECPKLSVALK